MPFELERESLALDLSLVQVMADHNLSTVKSITDIVAIYLINVCRKEHWHCVNRCVGNTGKRNEASGLFYHWYFTSSATYHRTHSLYPWNYIAVKSGALYFLYV